MGVGVVRDPGVFTMLGSSGESDGRSRVIWGGSLTGHGSSGGGLTGHGATGKGVPGHLEGQTTIGNKQLRDIHHTQQIT